MARGLTKKAYDLLFLLKNNTNGYMTAEELAYATHTSVIAISLKLLRNAPFTPQSFRAHRAFNLYAERGLDEAYVRAFFGWRDPRVLKLIHILDKREYSQMEMLKKMSSHKPKGI